VTTLKEYANRFAPGELTTYTKADHELKRKLLVTPIQTNENSWKNAKHRDAIMSSRWGEHFLKLPSMRGHDISVDNLPDEINFTTDIVPPRTPELIGRELMPIMPVTQPTTKFPVFSRGRSSKSARGQQDYRSSAGKMEYRVVTLQDSWNTADTVDQDFLEDIQPGIIQEYWGELTRAHRELVSENFVEYIVGGKTAAESTKRVGTGTFTDGSGNTQPKGIDETSVTLGTLDALIEGLTKARQKFWRPDTILMDWVQMGAMLKNSNFQNADYFREYANFDEGMINSVLNMNIMVSDQIPTALSGYVWMFEKNRYACAAIRRDELITNLRDDGTLSQGLSISSRYGFAHKDGSAIVRLS